MKFVILAILIFGSYSRILFQDDFENDLNKFQTGSTSGAVVSCPEGRTSKCLQITKKVEGGDLFTIPFENPTNPTKADDII